MVFLALHGLILKDKRTLDRLAYYFTNSSTVPSENAMCLGCPPGWHRGF